MDRPKTEKLMDLLKDYPEGLTIDEIREKLNYNSNKEVGNTVQLLKQRDVKFKQKRRGFYQLIEDKTSNTIIKDLNHNSIIPKKYQDVFFKLSDSDKSDCIDMLRKSLYYHKSAISLLESNKEVLSFLTSIERDL